MEKIIKPTGEEISRLGNQEIFKDTGLIDPSGKPILKVVTSGDSFLANTATSKNDNGADKNNLIDLIKLEHIAKIDPQQKKPSTVKKITASLVTALIAFCGAGLNKLFADHYSSYPGPADVQLDTRVIYDQCDFSFLEIPKYYPGEGKYLIAAPIKISENGFGDPYLNFGKFLKNDNYGVLTAFGLGHNCKDGFLINPQLYLTLKIGDKVIVDPSIQYLVHPGLNDDKLVYGSSFGVKVHERIILGAEFSKTHNLGDLVTNAPNKSDLKGNFRFELGPKTDDPKTIHKYWAQIYFGKDSIILGFRTNFNL